MAPFMHESSSVWAAPPPVSMSTVALQEIGVVWSPFYNMTTTKTPLFFYTNQNIFSSSVGF